MALTDTFVRNKKHSGKAGYDKHADTHGLYLAISPAGGKLWRMDYRHAGKRKTLSLGAFPAVTLAKARKARDAARELLAEGIDPSDAKRAQKAAQAAAATSTVEVIAREWLALKRPGWSESHYVRESRNVEKDLIPALGKRELASVRPVDLLAVCKKAEARGAPSVAERLLWTARGIWTHAILTDRAANDITHGLTKGLQTRQKGNYPAIVEPVAFGQLLRDIDAYRGGPVVSSALKIAPVLFQRPGNLRTMRWRDVDLDRGHWTIPPEDMKGTKQEKISKGAHEVPLPTQVVAVLRDIQPLTGHLEHVFPGFRDPTKPMSEAALTAALHAMGYKGVQSWHGFRASGRTMVREQLKFDHDVIETQLAHSGHIKHGGAYDRAKFVDERRVMAQRWADYLDKLRAGADVIPLHRTA